MALHCSEGAGWWQSSSSPSNLQRPQGRGAGCCLPKKGSGAESPQGTAPTKILPHSSPQGKRLHKTNLCSILWGIKCLDFFRGYGFSVGAQEGGRTSPCRTRRDIQCLLLAAVGTGLLEPGHSGWRMFGLADAPAGRRSWAGKRIPGLCWGREMKTQQARSSTRVLEKKIIFKIKCFSESVAAFKSGRWWRGVARLQRECRCLQSSRTGGFPPLDGGGGDLQGRTPSCRRTKPRRTLRRGERSSWWGGSVLPPSKRAEMPSPLPRQEDLPVLLRTPH